MSTLLNKPAKLVFLLRGKSQRRASTQNGAGTVDALTAHAPGAEAAASAKRVSR